MVEYEPLWKYALVEPLMMVVLGVVMGALVLALYLPVFQLGQVL